MNLLKLPADVVLCAAGKSRNAEQILNAIDSGVKVIGMNYIQEAEQLISGLGGKAKAVQWHMIGHLQSNKVRKAVELFDMIQTVDSFKKAHLISTAAKGMQKVMPVLIEVNIAKEDNKHGVFPEDVLNLAKEIIRLPNICLNGLMTMGPNVEEQQLRQYFRQANDLYQQLKTKAKDINILSMGMSSSYKAAIEEGSTMVRLGTILFGPRG